MGARTATGAADVRHLPLCLTVYALLADGPLSVSDLCVLTGKTVLEVNEALLELKQTGLGETCAFTPSKTGISLWRQRPREVHARSLSALEDCQQPDDSRGYH